VTWLLLALAAYCIGQIIFLLEMKAERPDRHLIPCAVKALAWPLLVVRRSIAQRRPDRTSQW
jgi:hypothetical protein